MFTPLTDFTPGTGNNQWYAKIRATQIVTNSGVDYPHYALQTIPSSSGNFMIQIQDNYGGTMNDSNVNPQDLFFS